MSANNGHKEAEDEEEFYTESWREGGCHCGALRFKVLVPDSGVDVFKCGCSVCWMKQSHHFLVP